MNQDEIKIQMIKVAKEWKAAHDAYKAKTGKYSAVCEAFNRFDSLKSHVAQYAYLPATQVKALAMRMAEK
jgi:hypothetical protein